MKISVDVDCTPAEARAFFGLPDLSPVHDVYVSRMTRFAEEGVSQADMERMMQRWMDGMASFGSGGLQDLQKMMAAAMGSKPKA